MQKEYAALAFAAALNRPTRSRQGERNVDGFNTLLEEYGMGNWLAGRMHNTEDEDYWYGRTAEIWAKLQRALTEMTA